MEQPSSSFGTRCTYSSVRFVRLGTTQVNYMYVALCIATTFPASEKKCFSIRAYQLDVQDTFSPFPRSRLTNWIITWPERVLRIPGIHCVPVHSQRTHRKRQHEGGTTRCLCLTQKLFSPLKKCHHSICQDKDKKERGKKKDSLFPVNYGCSGKNDYQIMREIKYFIFYRLKIKIGC